MQTPIQQQPAPLVQAGADDQDNEEQEGSFTIDASQIEDSIKKQMDKDQISGLERILDVGNELIFGKETHFELMNGLKNSSDIGKDLGEGAFHLIMVMLKQSKNTLPGEVIIPAGVILLARVSEFMNHPDSGMPQVTDDDFEEATHTFTTLTMAKLDPDYQKRMQASGQEESLPQDMPQQQGSVPQQSGLLNATEGGY